jgi:hypothetical protein
MNNHAGNLYALENWSSKRQLSLEAMRMSRGNNEASGDNLTPSVYNVMQ